MYGIDEKIYGASTTPTHPHNSRVKTRTKSGRKLLGKAFAVSASFSRNNVSHKRRALVSPGKFRTALPSAPTRHNAPARLWALHLRCQLRKAIAGLVNRREARGLRTQRAAHLKAPGVRGARREIIAAARRHRKIGPACAAAAGLSASLGAISALGGDLCWVSRGRARAPDIDSKVPCSRL